jgi:hypothetical protein
VTFRPPEAVPWRSSSPLRGAATSAASARPSGGRGRHRPSEGQQHLPQVAVPGPPFLSSSPLRGAATPRHVRDHPPRRHVVIAPPRGSNNRRRGAATRSALVVIAPPRGSNKRHTRRIPAVYRVVIAPPRGSNKRHTRRIPAVYRVVIAPPRGSNTLSSSRFRFVACSRHRPSEGQQQDLLNGDPGVSIGSSSPLRGAATGVPRVRLPRLHIVVIAPPRGSNQNNGSLTRGFMESSSPLRGAATCRTGPATRCCWCRSSSPLRGAATRSAGPARRASCRPVVIAPPRGSNVTGAAHWPSLRVQSSSPLRGAASCRPRTRGRWSGPRRGDRACPAVPSHTRGGPSSARPTCTVKASSPRTRGWSAAGQDLDWAFWVADGREEPPARPSRAESGVST